MQHFTEYLASADTTMGVPGGKVRVTFFGTSTLLFNDGETQLLIDGFFSRPPLLKVALGKVGSNAKKVQQAITQYNIKPAGVFVCHSHYDHVMDAPAIAKLTRAVLYGSASTLNVGKGAGLTEQQMQLFEPGKELVFGNFKVTVIESKHTPPFKVMGKTNATNPNHPNIEEPLKQPAKAEKYIEGGTYDFYITYKGKGILVKASTNYMEGALKSYPAEVFFLGAAMLGKQDNTFRNRYYSETVNATGAKLVVPIHWDNFGKPLTKPLQALPNLGDNVEEGFRFLINKTAENKVQFKWLQGGNSMLLF